MIKIIALGSPAKETFYELTKAIQYSLNDLEYDSQIYYFSKKTLNLLDIHSSYPRIFINGQINKINEYQLEVKSNDILIQTEQLHRHNIQILYHKWGKVLDFFPEQTTNTPAIYFPLGYSSAFDTNLDLNIEDFSFFFGYPTKYRQKMLDKVDIFNKQCYFNDRDKYILRAKYNINLKAFKSYFFAPLHALLVLCKGRVLFQEECDGGYGIYKDKIVLFNKKTYFNVLQKWSKDKLYSVGNQIRQDLMKNHSFTKYFKECIEGIL